MEVDVNAQAESGYVRNCRLFSRAASAIGIFVGTLAMLGWLLSVSMLIRILPGLATMKPNTALCFVLAGMSLGSIQLSSGDADERGWRYVLVARVLSGMVALVGLLTLAEYLLSLDLGIDALLFRQTLQASGLLHPGRMAGATALGFVLFGGSVLLMSNQWPYPSQSLALLTSLNGLVACVGYMLSVPSLYEVAAYSSMALHTALLFAVLGLAVLAARPRLGVMASITSEHTGGAMARRVLPFVLAVPMLLGWLRWKGQVAGLYGTQFGIALLILGEFVIFATMVWLNAVRLNQIDRARREAQRRSYNLSSIVASSDDAMLSLDLSATIISWNRGAEDLFGYCAAEIIGRPVASIIPSELHEEANRFLSEVRGGHLVAREHTLRRHKDGSLVHVSLIVSPVRDIEGQVIGSAAIAHDISERLQAQGERERLAAIVDSSDDAIIGKDLNGTINAWNRGAEKIFGYSAEEATGKSMQMLFPPDIVKEESEILSRIRSGESVEHFETVRVRKDGTKIDVSVTISPIRDGNGTIVGASKIARDITERKRVEAALHESEERLRLTIDGARVGIWHRDCVTGALEWSPLCFTLHGVPPSTKVDSETLRAIVHPEDRVRISKAIERSLEDRSEYDVEYRVIWPDGSERWIAARGEVYQNAAGENTRIGGVLFDITDRRLAEQRLAGQADELFRQAEELIRSQQALETQKLLLQSVLDSMAEGLVVADERGQCIIWNPAASKIIGISGANLSQEDWSAHYGAYLPDTVTPFPIDQNPLLRAIRGEVSSAELFVRNPALGRGVWIESNGAPLKDKSGVIQGGVVAFRDITQRKAAELEIRKLNETLEERITKRTEQLETANRELESFTYSVSHDLRAPLRHIRGFAEACLEEFGDNLVPQARHYLQRIQDGTRRMGVLTDELLNLARTGQRPLNLQLTGLNSIVEEIISMLKAETEGREVEWKVGSLPSAKCDAVLIRQVFQNLLSNAIKYSRTRAHAVIEIGHTKVKGEPVIFVRDNGVGFKMKYADKLFGVFQRLHCEEEFEGTGVGLATVHRILQKHGGRIWAEAEIDQGATFYFTLSGIEISGSRSGMATAGA